MVVELDWDIIRKMTRLTTAINELYVAFANISKPEKIEGCPCCIEESELKRLLRVPLREISGAELAPYASSALLTVGEVADYLYFLPRILDVSIGDESWWPTIEVTARAIRSTNPEEWPDARVSALSDLLVSVIGNLVDEGEYSRIDEWMCAIGRMEFNVLPSLKVIESDPNAVLEFWKDNAGKLGQGVLGNAFWELPNKQHDEIVRWFNLPEVSIIFAEEYGYRMG